ncbi:MAG: DUF6544 family protein [Myxococcota bacterium]
MKIAIGIILVLHGLIHFMGFAKAFELADLAALSQPIGRPMGLVWLAAALLMLGAAAALFAGATWWWALAGVAVVTSQVAIFSAWSDARFGTIPNALLLAGVIWGFLADGPTSFHAEYLRSAERTLAAASPGPRVTDHDLAHLPTPVARYLRQAGVLGEPRVDAFRVRMTGHIRSGPSARWMPFTVEQTSSLSRPTRLFFMRASMLGVPFEAWHQFQDGKARMRVKVASLVSVVDVDGPTLTAAEVVTLFNDLCLLAPGGLIDPSIGWQALDPHTARATWTHAGHTIHADLAFNDRDELVGFVSDDRYALEPDGKSFTQARWSTPLGAYRSFDGHQLAGHGEARWHMPEGTYTYGRFEIRDVRYDPAPSAARSLPRIGQAARA